MRSHRHDYRFKHITSLAYFLVDQMACYKTNRMNFRNEVSAALKEIESILIFKNEKYGNSALEPLGVFSQLSPREGLLIRIDDKLKRIKNGSLANDDEDVVNDLIGYLVLLKIQSKESAVDRAMKGEEGKWDFHDINLDGI